MKGSPPCVGLKWASCAFSDAELCLDRPGWHRDCDERLTTVLNRRCWIRMSGLLQCAGYLDDGPPWRVFDGKVERARRDGAHARIRIVGSGIAGQTSGAPS